MESLLYFCLDGLFTTLVELVLIAYLGCRASGGWPPYTPDIVSVVLSRQRRIWRRAKKNWPEDKKNFLEKDFLLRLLPILCYEVGSSIGYPYFLRWQQIPLQAYDYVRMPVFFLILTIAMLIILIAGDDDTSSDKPRLVGPPLPRFALPLPRRAGAPRPAPRPVLRTNKQLHPPARREPAQGAE